LLRLHWQPQEALSFCARSCRSQTVSRAIVEMTWDC
jgi:hypothetical protein